MTSCQQETLLDYSEIVPTKTVVAILVITVFKRGLTSEVNNLIKIEMTKIVTEKLVDFEPNKNYYYETNCSVDFDN